MQRWPHGGVETSRPLTRARSSVRRTELLAIASGLQSHQRTSLKAIERESVFGWTSINMKHELVLLGGKVD